MLQCGGASFFYFYEEVLPMGKNTRIYNKFEYWSVEDCDCKYCLHYNRKKGCKLTECCCADIRREAARRELAWNNGAAVCRV